LQNAPKQPTPLRDLIDLLVRIWLRPRGELVLIGSGGLSDALSAPIPGQKFVDAPGGMIRQAGKYVGKQACGSTSLSLAVAIRV
jgi:hypothetical protein